MDDRSALPWGLICPARPQTPVEGCAHQYARVGPEGMQRLRKFENGTCLKFGPMDIVDEFLPIIHPFHEQVALIDVAISDIMSVRTRQENSGWNAYPEDKGEATLSDGTLEKYAFNGFRLTQPEGSLLPGIIVDGIVNGVYFSWKYRQAPSIFATCGNAISVYSTRNKSEPSVDSRFGVLGRLDDSNTHATRRGGHGSDTAGSSMRGRGNRREQQNDIRKVVETYKNRPRPTLSLQERNIHREYRLRMEEKQKVALDQKNKPKLNQKQQEPFQHRGEPTEEMVAPMPGYRYSRQTMLVNNPQQSRNFYPEFASEKMILTPYGHPQQLITAIHPQQVYPVLASGYYQPVPHYAYQSNIGSNMNAMNVEGNLYYSPQDAYLAQQNARIQPGPSNKRVIDDASEQGYAFPSQRRQLTRLERYEKKNREEGNQSSVGFKTVANPTGQRPTPVHDGEEHIQPLPVPPRSRGRLLTAGRNGLAASTPGSKIGLSSRQNDSQAPSSSNSITIEHLRAGARPGRALIDLNPTRFQQSENDGDVEDEDEDHLEIRLSRARRRGRASLRRVADAEFAKMCDDMNRDSRARGDNVLAGDRASGDAMAQERLAVLPSVPSIPIDIIPPTPLRLGASSRSAIDPSTNSGAPPIVTRSNGREPWSSSSLDHQLLARMQGDVPAAPLSANSRPVSPSNLPVSISDRPHITIRPSASVPASVHASPTSTHRRMGAFDQQANIRGAFASQPMSRDQSTASLSRRAVVLDQPHNALFSRLTGVASLSENHEQHPISPSLVSAPSDLRHTIFGATRGDVSLPVTRQPSPAPDVNSSVSESHWVID